MKEWLRRRWQIVRYGALEHLSLFETILVAVIILSLLGILLRATQSVWAFGARCGDPPISRTNVFIERGGVRLDKPDVFLASVIDKNVTFYVIPADAPDKVVVMRGPYLFGTTGVAGLDLQTKDYDDDGKQDVIASLNGEQLVYLQRNGELRYIREVQDGDRNRSN